jgi:hypothetical protein
VFVGGASCRDTPWAAGDLCCYGASESRAVTGAEELCNR